ncbi:VWA domain-containing protein [Phytohabitans sp. ZYX-F-186]|uniref:VWA domain-containing protein n=1 Tax=Phytohabitans maris TaxID=3071409 RepID=A0ABU0ZCS9_9ACTN|nr:VWA domain-containing protein [Phytohabitans sp. ZYX-F-186]MDQ7904864.1 VWA domain-containing protein [Phytohabitans sp. ZYX-F-186]
MLAADHLWGFLGALRRAGVGAAPAKQADFLRAIAGAAPRDVRTLYWYARVTLLGDVAGLAAFDRVFDAWFVSGVPVEALGPPPSDVEGEVAAAGDGGTVSTMEARPGGGIEASAAPTTGGRTFGRSDTRQRDLMRLLREAWPARLPVVPSRRRRPARAGRRLDMRRVWRQARRDGGELTRLRWTTRPPRARRLLLLLDVSGSLKRHTPELIRLAHTAPARTEVFTFGTHLTRVTKALADARVDAALAAVSRTVTDADGGTAIGEALGRFLANPRFLALARGALVVVISDGLERGDCTAMVRAVERLSRLGHRLLWWSPLACSPTYRPVTRGMAALLPHLDRLGGVRDLATGLSEVERIPHVVAGPRRAAWRHYLSGTASGARA